MFEDIEALTLIASEACNLNCSYCNIAHELDPKKHAITAQAVRESLKNGTYLKNVLDVCKKFNIDKNKIKHFHLWGQEPTLNMNEIAEAFPSFYEEFPNINQCFFSTNSVAYYDRIIKYVKKVDETVNCPTSFEVQFSFDGTDITEKSRGINPKIILDNIKSLFLALNEIELKNVTFEGHFHNVITVELMKKLLESDEEFFKFFNDLDSIICSYLDIIKNDKVKLRPFFSPGIVNPYNATVEDGKILADFYKKCLYFQPKPIEAWETLVGMFSLPILAIKNDIYDIKEKNVDSIVNAIAYYEQLTMPEAGTFISHISHTLACGWGYGNLKIRYDGTLMHCHNVLFGMDEEELNYSNKDDLRHNLQRSLLKHGYYPNLKDAQAEENFRKLAERAYICSNSSFLFSYSQIVNLMLLLLKCNQIDETYKTDINKMLRHAFILTCVLPCWDNNLMETGSGFGRTAGHIRFYCNGFINYIDDFWKERGV